jgi:hypothetical protein
MPALTTKEALGYENLYVFNIYLSLRTGYVKCKSLKQVSYLSFILCFN